MAKGYIVVTYRSVKDPEKLAAYAKLAGPAVQAYGGRFLVRGVAVKAYEAGIKERTVVIEFPSVQAVMAAYEGPEYRKALDVLGDSAVRDMRVVEGVE